MDILKVLKELNGYWHYNGGRYLAKLTSGKVSDTYCNCGVLTSVPDVMASVVSLLATKFVLRHGKQPEEIGLNCGPTLVNSIWKEKNGPNLYVCGPAMGGVTLAYEVARHLGGMAIFTEPMYDQILMADGTVDVPGDYEIHKVDQELKRFTIPEGATVLFVEDVITTGNSTREMIEAVVKSCGGLHPPDADERCVGGARYPKVCFYVLCLVNRSGLDTLHMEVMDGIESSFQIISLADIQA